MAKYITKFDKKFIMDLPFSIRRNTNLPLDLTSTYTTLNDAEKYSKESSLSYVGQIISVGENNNTRAFLINDESGSLLEIATLQHIDLSQNILNTEISNLNQKITDLDILTQNRITESVNDLKEDITAQINTETSNLNREINAIKDNISTEIETEVSKVIESFQDNQNNINQNYNEKINSNLEEINLIKENIDSFKKDTDSKINVLTATHINDSSNIRSEFTSEDIKLRTEFTTKTEEIISRLEDLQVKTANDNAITTGKINFEISTVNDNLNYIKQIMEISDSDLQVQIDAINAKKTIKDYNIIDAYTKSEITGILTRKVDEIYETIDERINNTNSEVSSTFEELSSEIAELDAKVNNNTDDLQSKIDIINAKNSLSDYGLDDDVYDKTQIDEKFRSQNTRIDATFEEHQVIINQNNSKILSLESDLNQKINAINNKTTLDDYGLRDDVYDKIQIDTTVNQINEGIDVLFRQNNENFSNLNRDIESLSTDLNGKIQKSDSEISTLKTNLESTNNTVALNYSSIQGQIIEVSSNTVSQIGQLRGEILGNASTDFNSLKKIENKIIDIDNCKQDKLTVGENIKIIDNVISAVISVDDIPDLDLKDYVSVESFNAFAPTKQDTLVSGTNIKTLNNESLLGEGNIDLQLNFDRLNNVPETLVVKTEIDGNTLSITDYSGNISEFKGVTDYRDLTNTPVNISEFINDKNYVNPDEAKQIASNELDRLTSESSGALETFKELIDMIENDETGITALINRVNEHDDSLSSHDERITELEENNGNFAALQEYIKTNDENISEIRDNLDSLNITAEKVEGFLLDADLSESAKDTLKELQAYIESDTTGAAQMAENISKNTTDIQTINDKIENFDFEVDLSDYYTKTETNGKFATLGNVSEDYNTLEKIEDILVDKVGMTEIQSATKKLENSLTTKITELKNLHAIDEESKNPLTVAVEAQKIVEDYFANFWGGGSEGIVYLDGGRISKK